MNRNQKKKKFLKNKMNVIIIITIILVIFTAIKISNRNDTTKKDIVYNKNRSFTKKQKIKGIIFKDIKCSYDGKDSIITYTMINDTKKEIALKNYDIYVKNKDNEILTKIAVNVAQKIKPKEELAMANQVVGVDLSNAHYLELKVKTK